jgi:hypothetical protein
MATIPSPSGFYTVFSFGYTFELEDLCMFSIEAIYNLFQACFVHFGMDAWDGFIHSFREYFSSKLQYLYSIKVNSIKSSKAEDVCMFSIVGIYNPSQKHAFPKTTVFASKNLKVFNTSYFNKPKFPLSISKMLDAKRGLNDLIPN